MENLPNLKTARAIEFLTSARENHKRQSKDFPFMIPKRKPRFDYQNLPETERLRYELLTWDNYKQMFDLFQNDPNPFVMDDFKTIEDLEMYAVSQLEYNWYSFKRGACDWFLWSKDTSELVGVLHLYDLNWELYEGKHPSCTVGYAIGEKYRRKGFAFEAMSHLLTQIPLIFKRYEVGANPKIANINSRYLLEKLGFIEHKEVGDDESWWEKQLVEEIPLKTSDEVWEEEKKYR